MKSYQEYINGTIAKGGGSAEVNFTFFRNVLTIVTNYESNPYIVLGLTHYKASPILLYGTLPDFITVTHTIYSSSVTITSTSDKYTVFYSLA